MSNYLTNLIENTTIQATLPQTESITEEAQLVFETGLEKLREYRGDPTILQQGLHIFHNINSLPLFYAGVAYTHMLGAYEQATQYNKYGLGLAQKWLNMAEGLAPNSIEVNLIQASIYLSSQDLVSAKTCLDKLAQSEQSQYTYYITASLMEYAGRKGDKAQLHAMQMKGLQEATSMVKKAAILNGAGGHYMQQKLFNDALSTYQLLSELTPQDAWMWHNMSIIYFIKNQLIKSYNCNKRALSIMKFGNALYIQKKIQARLKKKALGVTAYVVVVLAILIRAFLI